MKHDIGSKYVYTVYHVHHSKQNKNNSNEQYRKLGVGPEHNTFKVIVFGSDDVLCEITFPYLVIENQGFQMIKPLSHLFTPGFSGAFSVFLKCIQFIEQTN